MELQEIEVIINKDGQVSIKVQGMAGDSCLAATAALEQLLGGAVSSRERTDGFEGSVVLPQTDTIRNKT